jgi:hypothetical protein
MRNLRILPFAQIAMTLMLGQAPPAPPIHFPSAICTAVATG